MLHSIQALRGIAALLVVIYHTTFVLFTYGNDGGALAMWWRSFALPLEAGVDLFFVVSGFIMVHIRHRYVDGQGRHGWQFFTRRAERVMPPYWIYTTVILAVLLFVPAFGGEGDMPSVLHSYFLLPYEGNFLLFVGWTLAYELMFYTMFAVTMVLFKRQRVHVAALGLMFASFAVFGYGRTIDDGIMLYFYSQPIILEFVFGMIIGHLFSRRLLPGAGVGALISLFGIGLFYYLNYPIDIPLGGRGLADSIVTLERLINYGIPAGLIVAGIVCIEDQYGKAVPGLLQRIGDASYSLYLSHILGLHAIGMVWRVVVQRTDLPTWGLACLCIIGTLVYAQLSWKLVEVRMLAWMKTAAHATRFAVKSA